MNLTLPNQRLEESEIHVVIDPFKNKKIDIKTIEYK